MEISIKRKMYSQQLQSEVSQP